MQKILKLFQIETFGKNNYSETCVHMLEKNLELCQVFMVKLFGEKLGQTFESFLITNLGRSGKLRKVVIK